MHKEAVTLIKEQQVIVVCTFAYEKLTLKTYITQFYFFQTILLPPLILEKLFRNDLTALFRPDHIVYKQIIEYVFVNESLTGIEENAKILINELKKQKYILEALHIIKLMEGIPSILCTFDTCFQLLIQE